jgi:hypothetical protein
MYHNARTIAHMSGRIIVPTIGASDSSLVLLGHRKVLAQDNH